jgi:hypothetical protein
MEERFHNTQMWFKFTKKPVADEAKSIPYMSRRVALGGLLLIVLYIGSKVRRFKPG